MELLAVLMIVGIFGVWIYGLKQEISALQKRVPGEQLNAMHSHEERPAGVPAASQSTNQPVHRDGVQTWVLE